MRTFLSFLFAMACVIGGCKDFLSYKSLFHSLGNYTKINRLSWGDTIISNFIDTVDFEMYLPKMEGANRSHDGQMAWQAGSCIDYGNINVMLLQQICLCCEDENSHWFMEYNKFHYIVATYNHQGKQIDSKIVGTSARDVEKAIFEGNFYDFYVTQCHLTDVSQRFQYGNLDYSMVQKRVTIDKLGYINIKQVGEPRKETTSNDVADNIKIPFKEFLDKFKEWEKSYLNDSVFHPTTPSGLSRPFVKAYIPDTLNCDCWPTETSWRPCHYIKLPNSYLLCIIKDCDFPKEDEYLFADYILLSYNKEGQLLDCQSVARFGDSYKNTINYQLYPFKINVTQTLPNPQTFTYKVDDMGKITTKRIKPLSL